MKRAISLLLAVMVFAGCFVLQAYADEGSSERKGQSEGIIVVDSITSASVQNAFVKWGLTGDELMDAIDNKGGVTVISTCAEDRTPNVAILEWFMTKKDDKYYIALNMQPNQTSANLESGSEAIFLYANMDDPYEGATRVISTHGAKIVTKMVEDDDLVSELCLAVGKRAKGEVEGLYAYAFEVTEVRPLG